MLEQQVIQLFLKMHDEHPDFSHTDLCIEVGSQFTPKLYHYQVQYIMDKYRKNGNRAE